MQIIYNTALVAGLASTAAVAQAPSESTCSTFSTTLTSTIATVTVTVSSDAETSSASVNSASYITVTSGSCAAGVSTSSSITANSTTTGTVAPSTTAWTLSALQCVSASKTVGVNTIPGLNGTAYLVCPGAAPFPTVSTITPSGNATADAVGATHPSSFTFFPTGVPNATVPATGIVTAPGIEVPPTTSVVVAPTTSIIPFSAGACALDAKKTLLALAGIAVGMVFL